MSDPIRTVKVFLLPVEVESRDRAVQGSFTPPSDWENVKLKFKQGGKDYGSYSLDDPQETFIYEKEADIFSDSETEDSTFNEAAKYHANDPEVMKAINQDVVLYRDEDNPDKINFLTVFDKLTSIEITIEVDGEDLATIDHELTEEEDFGRLIAALAGIINGEDPPEIETPWFPQPTGTGFDDDDWDKFTDSGGNISDDAVSDAGMASITAAAPASVSANYTDLSILRIPQVFEGFFYEVWNETTEIEWLAFVQIVGGQNQQLATDVQNAMAAAPGGGAPAPVAGASRTNLQLPAEIKKRGLVARCLIYWVKKHIKANVAVGEGVVFGLWDGIKGDVVGVVDSLRLVGDFATFVKEYLEDPYRVAGELYHSFKVVKEMGWDGVKDVIKGMVAEFTGKQDARLEMLLGPGAMEDPVFMAAYYGGYITGYVGEQVAVAFFTAGASLGTKVGLAARGLRKGADAVKTIVNKAKAFPDGELIQRSSKTISTELGAAARKADDIRAARRNGSMCRSPNGCFREGTLVLMGDGSIRPIESIRGNDVVMADDPDDGLPPFPQRVEAQVLTAPKHFYRIAWDVDGDGAEDGAVSVTGDHPFWTAGKSWQPASEIQSGMRFRTDSEETATVLAVKRYEADRPSYNLDVAGPNSFFVASGRLGEFVLVHNAEYDQIAYGSDAEFDPISGQKNQKHHGIMNAWLQANFPLTYAGRIVEKDFPCIELSPANHSAASIVEQNFRNGAPKLPGSQKVDWKSVSARDALEVARTAYRAAGVSEELIAKQLSAINGWLKSNLLKYGCNP